MRPALAAAFIAALWTASAAGASGTLVVPRGQPVQIALANDLTGSASAFAPGVSNAVRMAVGFRPTVHGFPIQINVYDAPCGNSAGDVATAGVIVANPQNAGVLGQLCSSGFADALAVYQAAGIVTISGSATEAALGGHGFSVFDRLAVADPDFGSWYAKVAALPSDVAWRHGYEVIFGGPPMAFADIYYDAASLLIADLRRVSRVDRSGALVVDRAALASAVRATRRFDGVTCRVTLDPATGNRVNDPAALARCAGETDDSDVPRKR
jgi:ABC-type branched-subunit amino acid transport system substrate-binding protein